jgi:hypothetical protein
MKKPGEVSPGGSSIFRHEARERGFTPAAPAETAEEVERQLGERFGEPSTVFHEIVSDLVHLDVHLVPPRPERDCWTLFTTGMSDLPMAAPPGAEELRFAELVLSLPSHWRLDLLQATPPPPDLERWYWPVRWLKQLARLPHEYETWLGTGHTVPNGDPAEPFAPDTRLCCWLLLPPVSVPEPARQLALSDGRTVHVLALYPLYPEELGLKLDKGLDDLLDAFDRAGVSEVLTLDRPPVVRRKLFGLF